MANSEYNGNGVESGEMTVSARGKQLSGSAKKTALRDVQNENVGSIRKQQERLLPGGRSCGDTIKVCGTKRLTPECPLSSLGHPSLAYNGLNENVMNARRRFELELGRVKHQNSVERISDYSEPKYMEKVRQGHVQKITQTRDSGLDNFSSNNLTANMTFSSSILSVPSSAGKQTKSTTVTKVSPEIPHTCDSKSTEHLLRTGRFIHLQKFLKQCDEENPKERVQMLMQLPPPELSSFAVELEKRAIQLTIEEGNEMQRMKALNILAKSSPVNNAIRSTQLSQPNKR